jgi:hypothetical protein
MKGKKRSLGVYATILILLSCGWNIWVSTLMAQTDKAQDACSPASVGAGDVQLTYQDYTNLIAGKKMDATFLAKSVNPEGWLQNAEDMDQTWNRFEQKSLKPMRAWATQELAPAQTVEGTVFYPFSGPDVVNMLAFFPQAKTYLMIALEPVGTLPVFRPGANEPFYSGLEQSLSELLYYNFFFTKRMETNLVKKELDGVLPVLLFFLGRENVQVLDVKYWLMQPDGSITEKPVKGGEKLTGEGIPGVKIVFQRQAGEPEQTLYYFRFNLLNTFWRSHPHFVKFLQGFAPYQTFLKAASYLMFKPKFEDIRQFILDQSQMVLQTDEGIPLRYFDHQEWDRRFFGKYSCPIQLFANCFQSDMASMYRNGQNAQPLPFGIGYHHRRDSSNLMLASRKVALAEEVAK